ncbi:type I secretion system permease/ATPase [Zwartia sp.]|uniref:type I secretion system permease/ATPase n=1 Tax=Zwartia sp. TaxID=2978004 RepID=UPI003BAED9ED
MREKISANVTVNPAEGHPSDLDLDRDRETYEHADPILVCFALLAKIIDRPAHLAALRTGFSLDDSGRIPPDSYPDLARMHGMLATWTRYELAEIPGYVMPVIIPLVDGRACVMVGKKGKMTKVLMAESGMNEVLMPMEQLVALSSGDVLMVKASSHQGAQQMVPFRGKAFEWFWSNLWRFKRFYVESMLASVVANILTLAVVFFAMNVYDRVVPTQAYTSLWTLAIGTSIAIVLEFSMRWLKAYLVDLGGKKADLAINSTLLREIMTIRLEHRPQSIGIFSSSMRDFDALRDFFSSASLVLLADMPFIILFVAFIGIVAGPLAWIPALVVPVLIVVGLLAQKPLMRAMRQSMKESGDKQSVLVESMLNLELLKAHNAESYLQRRWEHSNLAAADSYKKIRSMTNMMLGLTTMMQHLVTVAMVVWGVYLIGANQLTLGGLIASVILAGRAIAPLGSVMSLAARYQQAVSSLETLDGLMKRPRDRELDRRYIVPDQFEGGIAAKDVEFAYPGEHKIPVINRVSFSLEAGDHLGMLGRVGSGKSTLLRLMAGLYTPTAGSILINGIDMHQIDPAELRARIGYVGQDPQLFMGTLRENLTLSDSWLSDSKVIDVLNKLDLYSMVARHPRGLDMPLTEAGGGLSGGQRQLLAVARMMLRDPAYVFLDEPTSHMDQNSEAKVIEVLGQWLEGRTLILATHRMPLLKWTNRLAVLERGELMIEGPSEEVIKKLSVGVKTTTRRRKTATIEQDLAQSNGALKPTLNGGHGSFPGAAS